MRSLTFLLVTITFCACTSQDQSQKKLTEFELNKSEYLRLPIDPLKVISTLSLVDSISFLESIPIDTQIGFRTKVDTLDLVYNGVMCDCPNWTISLLVGVPPNNVFSF